MLICLQNVISDENNVIITILSTIITFNFNFEWFLYAYKLLSIFTTFFKINSY